ncbi:hypothetical protein FRB96_005840 [Tulasnella sp. 330]|nr:hypothetical protein FRB96_005840 [Tulasnella sp. 330]KAG8875321.1 hypothetical protein FRB97_005219 [Tulasnella sp. 331]KAG8888614.1 hypothetical protein FRB98_007287 [Tulasnella sp. 332]
MRAEDLDQRLQAYRNLDETRKGQFNKALFEDEDVWSRWWLTNSQGFILSKMIAIASGPQRKLVQHPNNSRGIKMVCNEKWKTLSWEDKLTLRELVMAMTEQWEQFKDNVIDGPHGYIN